MDIIEALKKENLRIDYGYRWLMWSRENNHWQVMERKYKQKRTRVLYSGEFEEEAISILLSN